MNAITLHDCPMFFSGGRLSASGKKPGARNCADRIIDAHNSGTPGQLRLRFDVLASHDITYVGILQNALSGGLEKFPVPYVLTCCHNSLCAVGGTINEDDHLFGLSAAKRFGGEFVPPHVAVIHQYMRERYAGAGRMILGSDSHTRYGAFGTLAVGEGGPELVKQLLGRTYDLPRPPVVAVELTGTPEPGVGPQDVALALIKAVFKNNFVKNSVLEFFGPGVAELSMDYRCGIDVMTTETACLSSVWITDECCREYLAAHGREDAYARIQPDDGAEYARAVTINLSEIKPMIALPYHPSNAYTIEEFKQNAGDILTDAGLRSKAKDGAVRVDQAVIAGCAGGSYQNIAAASGILKGHDIGSGALSLSVYPASAPVALALTQDGYMASLMESGAVIRTAFCGPCFGAGDVPGNGALSIRHSTRNFENREGSRPADGQSAYVALMDARSIAATARNGGLLTAATELGGLSAEPTGYKYSDAPYRRVFRGPAEPETELRYAPSITKWPEQTPLTENITLTVAAAIYDPVTTTDELIPSGETSSYRSNPEKLASFTLSRKAPDYVKNALELRAVRDAERAEKGVSGIGSVVAALRPGDGSAREQAASCQRVLGGLANIALEYATKRYRSNLINWGILPFIWDDLEKERPSAGDRIEIRGIAELLRGEGESIAAVYTSDSGSKEIVLKLPGLSRLDRDILLAGCLTNYYRG